MIKTPGTYEEPDLLVDDVDTYTQGMLSAAADTTQNMLDAALAAARQDVRWHVAPVSFGEVIVLDGPGTNRLRLPTSPLWNNTITIHSITNDGVAVDPVNDVTVSADSPNLLILNSGRWSNNYSGITITWDHGFANAQAGDWRNAILSLVTNISQIAVVGRSDSELASKQIDDVIYRWEIPSQLGAVEPTLSKYRLLFRWV